MGLVANPPIPAPAPIADAIAGDGWFPPLSIAAFRQAQRLPGQVTDGRARDALIGAFTAVEVELAAWRAAQETAGAASLAFAQVTDAAGRVLGSIGGEPRPLVLWRRAVHAYAAAELAETHHDISATADGRARTEERAEGAGELLRAATLAIRDLLGIRRTRVRLL